MGWGSRRRRERNREGGVEREVIEEVDIDWIHLGRDVILGQKSSLLRLQALKLHLGLLSSMGESEE